METSDNQKYPFIPYYGFYRNEFKKDSFNSVESLTFFVINVEQFDLSEASRTAHSISSRNTPRSHFLIIISV